MALVKQAIGAIEDPSAKLLLQCQLGHFQLSANERKQAKETLEEVETVIKKQIRVPPPELLAQYHLACAELWKASNEVGKFYRNAMSYLGYAKDVTNQEAWANDIALAALADKSFYDFGELSLHPIMDSLTNSPRAWVLHVVQAFIRGELEHFNSVIQKYEKEIHSDEMLKNYTKVMNEKIRLLALVRLAFYKNSMERVLSFKEISVVADTDIAKVVFFCCVEQLVMRGMSVGLLKGIVDGIDETVTVTFVKPRILDRDEIAAMHKRSEQWVAKIEAVAAQLKPAIETLS
ncbi:hypothetical protein RFI_19126 [Reticulomyxa filosa]|uniref:PCI domain-containing protein n=1 Tax=Reticulomyxa filosa TaxID=46433 RepID=X6MYK6_RETFI|nr:hypothetical protein RFI_19126 [Reticulomyxa filosa]|eukprot:ETO18160.1 hypothetical protein RFI_19126 [Reticulomyxa filosa]